MNSSGILVRKIDYSSSETTIYLVDSANHTGYAQVFEETVYSGTSIDPETDTPSSRIQYTIGDDVISQNTSTYSSGWTAGITQFLLYDGHGSTRQLINNGPAYMSVSETFAYDAYGVATGFDASAAATNLLYTGEQFDSSLDQYYLRARYYNPSNGRFNRVDPYAGNMQDPQSLHKYTYVHNNPVNNIDPTGKWTTIQVITVGAIIGGVMGATLGTYVGIKRGYTVSEAEFWYWVGGGTITGATVGAISTWALIKFGMITVSTAGGTLGTGAASNINWLCDNAQRAWHIIRPEHLWNKIVPSLPSVSSANALQVYNTQVLPVIQKVVNNPSTMQTTKTLANGAQKIIYTGIVDGYTVIIQVWLSPTGQRVVENAYVAQ